ncbi:hypothetical protein [Nocardioides sp. SYSU D00038]|uniref:hypothetical protein n=1 Tax=Nocardioides sp. SYSU D00038 TaxID=2812554 RepID=UPI0019675354|nr:hypothetical protein [Nocardioides sp. SYSU D00038]
MTLFRAFSLATSMLLTAALVTLSPPANAATQYGWVYVVVNDRVCGTPGVKVRDVQANFQWSGGSRTINWERDGDNIVYPKVALKKTVKYQINARCFKKTFFGWTNVGYRVVTGSFKATKHKQTIWVG